MKKIIYLLFVITSIVFFSCKNDCGSCKNKSNKECAEGSCQKDTTQK